MKVTVKSLAEIASYPGVIKDANGSYKGPGDSFTETMQSWCGETIELTTEARGTRHETFLGRHSYYNYYEWMVVGKSKEFIDLYDKLSE
jgi:hypothetical protein